MHLFPEPTKNYLCRINYASSNLMYRIERHVLAFWLVKIGLQSSITNSDIVWGFIIRSRGFHWDIRTGIYIFNGCGIAGTITIRFISTLTLKVCIFLWCYINNRIPERFKLGIVALEGSNEVLNDDLDHDHDQKEPKKCFKIWSQTKTGIDFWKIFIEIFEKILCTVYACNQDCSSFQDSKWSVYIFECI